MYLLFSENIVSQQLLKNISLTLAHSLWQGIIAAILALLILTATKKASAALRYNLLFVNLLLFFVAVVVTFLLQPHTEKNTALPVQLIAGTVTQSYLQAPAENTSGNMSAVINFLSVHSPMIVLIWLMLTSVRLAHLIIGYWSINRIKKTQVTAAGDFWNVRLLQLVAAIKVTRPVQLLQSSIIKTPMVISYFKPVILIPVSLLTSLPQDEIEAILLHELSHIRRQDFIANLVQSFIETIFFFNPFVFWISGLIREERENCCDDLAVAQLKNKTILIKAMVSCREFDIRESSRYALAFGRQKEHLLNRVKRIINDTPRRFHAAEKCILFLCIPFLALVVMFPLQAFQKNEAKSDTFISHTISDTIPKNKKMNDETTGTVTSVNGVPHYHYEFRRSNVPYKVEKVDGKIVSVEISGKAVKANEIEASLPYVNSLIAEYDNIVNQPFVGLSPISDLSTSDAADSVKNAPLSKLTGLRGNMAGLNSPGGAENDLKPGVSTTNYFDKGYRVVVQDSVVVKVYYKGKALSAEKIKEHQAEIDGVLKGRQ